MILQSAAHTKTQIIKRINHLLDIKESNEFHQDFRLWIIVLETKAFPLEMLQRSFKGLSQFIHNENDNENENVSIVTKSVGRDAMLGCVIEFELLLMGQKVFIYC